jgi:hypothetical protein
MLLGALAFATTASAQNERDGTMLCTLSDIPGKAFFISKTGKITTDFDFQERINFVEFRKAIVSATGDGKYKDINTGAGTCFIYYDKDDAYLQRQIDNYVKVARNQNLSVSSLPYQPGPIPR